jgi:hypothetical protein
VLGRQLKTPVVGGRPAAMRARRSAVSSFVMIRMAAVIGTPMTAPMTPKRASRLVVVMRELPGAAGHRRVA